MSLLERSGFKVIVPEVSECGLPALSAGDIQTFKRIGERNLALLRPYIEAGVPLLSTEPSACLCFKEDYPDLLGSGLAESASRLSFELFEFLSTHEIKPELKSLDMRVAYHSPCHPRALEVGRPSLDFLR